MDCEEEEDASSLLSLPQSLLQQDNSSSTIGLSTTQFQNWPSSSVSATDIVGNFSPVSPVEAYGTTPVTGHTLTDNDNNFRLYGFRSVNNQAVTRDNTVGTFRGGNTAETSAVVQTNFSTSNRVSSASNAINNFNYNHSPSHVNPTNSSNLYYDQSTSLRSTNEMYGNKDTGISSRSGLNENYVGHHVNIPVVTSYSHASGYTDTQGVMGTSLNPTSEDSGKTTSESVQLDQNLFDSRIKTQDYAKDLNSIYDPSASKIAPKSLQSNPSHVSFDRRNQDSNNLDSNFEFQSNPREFTSSTRIDITSVNRKTQHSDYHQTPSGNANMPQSAIAQKYPTTHGGDSDSHFLNASFSLEPNSKRMPSAYMGFGLGEHGDEDYGCANDPQKKSASYQFNDLPSDLERVFHGSHQDFNGHQKTSLDIQRNFGMTEIRDIEESGRIGAKGQANTRESDNKWSGRPRAHRKMARLLASEDHRQRNGASQTVDPNNPMKMSFTKTLSDTQSKMAYQKDTRPDFGGSSKNFLSVEEEMDLRTNQVQQKSFVSRRDETMERHPSTHRDLGLMQHAGPAFSFDTSNMSMSMPKDSMTNILGGSHFLTSSNLELDFHPTLSVSQGQRDLDLNQHFVLQVPKEFEMDTAQNVGNQSDLSFDHPGDSQHINQPELSLPDNLGLGSHTQQDLNLEAYFYPSAEREISFGRKFSTQVSREMNYNAPSASENDFNIEEYMDPQPQRDLNQSYFERADLPQDMRMYQKTIKEKTATIHETSNLSKGRDKDQVNGEKVGEISELQKELTKTSTRESMKGIRIPRDINRAMEILQGLQEDEKEEARRRQQQQRQQQHQNSGLLSSPKKSFQNKHQVDNIVVSEHQFLGPSGSFMVDQSVGNILEQSHLSIPDQPQDSFQMMPPYQSFNPTNQPSDVDIASALHCKRDLPHNVDLDYHILKRLALSTSVKEPSLSQSSPFSNQTTNIASILSPNSNQDQEVQFPISGISNFQNHQPEMYDVMPCKPISSDSHSTIEGSRSKNDMQQMDFEPRQTSDNENPQNLQALTDNSQPVMDVTEAEILLSSRKSLYSMMQQEQFCDAVLSTSKQIVKVHKVVLCSMSQYLSTLLHTMQPTAPSDTFSTNLSSASCFSSPNTWNHRVLLVINNDGIQSSSMSAFLLYIYLGKTDFSENNITDLYMLACSLKVQSLKDLCKEFMSKAQISEDQIIVPQLLVSNQRMEMGDQASSEDVGNRKSYEDKSINTTSGLKTMEAATQTDRSTSEAGEGGQEEWVMLKKTKQKTVSPSKSRLTTTKSFSGNESPVGFKTGKKGWLSPKRRFMQKDHGNTCKDPAHNFGNVRGESNFKEASEKLPPKLESEHTQRISKQPNVTTSKALSATSHNLMNKDPQFIKQTVNNSIITSIALQMTTTSKSTRTTVEIAAAAAAAKLSAHSYGTRAARGVTKNQVSYAALASGQDKKKSASSIKEGVISAVSKKKDFIKSNPPSDFSTEPKPYSGHEKFTPSLKEKVDATHHNIDNNSEMTPTGSTGPTVSRPQSEAFKTMVKRPFKKSIVHRSRSEELLRNTREGNSVNNLNSNADDVTETSNQGNRIDSSLINVGEFTDSNVGNVSTLIDSIVNTMASETEDLDLQKVIHDWDNVLNKSPLLTATSASSVSSSFISPLKSPPSSTSESPSPLKSKSTPQGFRKRLIHLMNSEKSIAITSHLLVTPDSLIATSSKTQDSTTVTQSLANTPITTSVSQLAPSNPDKQNAITSLVKTVQEGKETQPNYLDQMSTKSIHELPIDAETHKEIISSEDIENGKSPDFLTKESLDFNVDAPVSSFSSMTDIELGLKEDDGNNFHHKIFKQKKKSKARKIATSETENTSIKMKLKKLQASDSECGPKSRQRKTTVSDTEGAGARPKQKKVVANETEGVVAKVRPPPKKRAKMELELLKAARSEGNQEETISDSLLSYIEDADFKPKESSGKELITEKDDGHNDSQNLKTPANVVVAEKVKGDKKSQKSDGKAKKKKTKDTGKAQRNSKAFLDPSQLTEGEITMETKLTLMLEELAKGQNLKSRLFTCNFCETQVRSARRTIKHMKSHGLDGEEILEKISIGERGLGQKACEICGYETKDQTYHYMHYHKYFKHGISLPLGWSTDKCEICGKECFTKFQLKEHMLSHDENFCFVCWQCGQSFKNRNGFNSHMFHKHSDVRKHDCKVCGRAFKTWTQLKVHVRSHTGERPFACTDCPHQSSTQGNMKIHLNTHGYSKAKVQELMEKISKNVPEEDPKSLEKTMLSIAEKLKADPNMSLKSPVKRKRKTSGAKNDPSGDGSSPKAKSETTRVKKKKAETKSTDKKTTHVSKFTGSHIKRLFMQPLNKMKPPKFLLPALSKQPSTESGSSSSVNADNVISQTPLTSDTDLNNTVDASNLSPLLQQQQQKQEKSGSQASATYLISVPQMDQATLMSAVQQQQSQQQVLEALASSLMGYIVIPTHSLSSQSGPETTADNTQASMSLPILSTPDILPSGLGTLQAGVQSLQLLQTDGVFNSGAAVSGLQATQDTVVVQDPATFLAGSTQGGEIFQNNSTGTLQYPNTNILVSDSNQHSVTTDTFQTVLATADATDGNTTVMVLPNVVGAAPQVTQSLNQQASTIFSYPDLITNAQSMLLPVTPSNFVNFPVPASAQEEVMTIGVQPHNFEADTVESEKAMTDGSDIDLAVSLSSAVDEVDEKVKLENNSLTRNRDSHERKKRKSDRDT